MGRAVDEDRQAAARRSIASELSLLQRQAAENGLEQLGYLIDMAISEARTPASILSQPPRMSGMAPIIDGDDTTRP